MLGKIAFIIQLTIAVTAVLMYRRFRSKFMFFLCFLLTVIVLVEGYGQYQIIFDTKRETISLISFFVFIEFILITLIYRSVVKNKKYLKLINFIAIFFLIIYGFSFFISNIKPFNLIPLEALSIAVIVIIYLTELLQSDKIIDYKKHLPFWVSVGFFVFYLSSIPFFSMHRYMVERNLFYIINWLIILMNVFIGIGLLCSNTKEKY